MKKQFRALPALAIGLLIGTTLEPRPAVSAESSGSPTLGSIELPPGFQAELIYSVPKDEQGSWVSMTFDPQGRIIASDQGGPAGGHLYRITLGNGEQPPQVEELKVDIGEAQGLLCALDSLYVVVNGGKAQGSGLYRVRDTDGDDQYDEVKLLKKLDGGGEHGPHAVVKGPDGQLYVIAGNFSKPPQGFLASSPHRNWDEDLLLPRAPDGNGFATGVMAPGGWIARTDPEGKQWEVLCGGFRNPYDMAFNTEGELFTYDADMEWDVGTPWYRPTRVNHCVSGAEFGWRYGSGKWPAYYIDSLGGFDIGLGSPTGVVFGSGAKFPAKYQRALYVLDWSYGKIYAMHLVPSGASYTATFEVFAAGKPLPVTDTAVGPDGALYFTVGGRGTQSALYRISYVGDEPTAPAAPLDDPRAAAARQRRRQLEAFHARPDPAAIELAWPHLNSPDRTLRYAARVAVEHQDPKLWQDKALGETRVDAALEALTALARAGDKSLAPRLIAALEKLPIERLSEEQQLGALRVLGLAFIRQGKPDAATAARLAGRFEALYPAASEVLNRELCQMLVYLESPSVVARSMALLRQSDTQAGQLQYVFALRTVRCGWDLELRKAYFSWLNLASEKYSGGASFKKFLEAVRNEAMQTLSEEEKIALRPVLERQETVHVVADETPRQFIHNWQMAEVVPLLSQLGRGRSFDRGQAAYRAAQCAKCHRFSTQGGSVGHDLTGVGNRFSPSDILEAIILPSKVISDQYASKTVVTTSGQTATGTVSQTPTGSIEVQRPNGEKVTFAKDDVDEVIVSPISTMPEGLLNMLSQEEILDLVAYLRSGGNAQDVAFQP